MEDGFLTVGERVRGEDLPLDGVLNLARRYAAVSGSRTLNTTHVLLACLCVPRVAAALVRAGTDVVGIRRVLADALEIRIGTTVPDRVPEIPFSAELSECLAIVDAVLRESDDVTASRLVVVIARRGPEEIRRLMEAYGFDAGMLTRAARGERIPRRWSGLPWFVDPVVDAVESPPLDIVPDEKSYRRVVDALERKTVAGAALVGPRGCGKSSLLRLLAHRVLTAPPESPESAYHLFGIDISLVVAGMRVQQGGTERLMDVLREVPKSAAPGTLPVLVVDDLTLPTPGTSGSDIASVVLGIVRREVRRRGVRFLVACRPEDWTLLRHVERVLADSLERVDPVAVGDSRTREAAARAAIRSVVRAHGRTVQKDAVEEMCRALRAAGRGDVPGDAARAADIAAISVPHAGEVDTGSARRAVSKLVGIPERALSSAPGERWCHVKEVLRSRVYGQDDALESVLAQLALAETGLMRSERPRGAFLFAGPTGSGKTETARALADALGMRLLRLDMSEFSERHTVARLIGAPPGYIGYAEHRAALVDPLIERPDTVVLFDEIEKAHPQVWNLLLQILDAGRLTASDGRLADFRHAWIVCTSNLGARRAESSWGFVDTGVDGGAAVGDAVRREMPPEIRNRFDRIVVFRRLDEGTVRRIARRFVEEGLERARERGFDVAVSDEVYDFLVEKGYDPAMGARPMDRAVRVHVLLPLARRMLEDGSTRRLRIVLHGERVVVVDDVPGEDYDMGAAGILSTR